MKRVGRLTREADFRRERDLERGFLGVDSSGSASEGSGPKDRREGFFARVEDDRLRAGRMTTGASGEGGCDGSLSASRGGELMLMLLRREEDFVGLERPNFMGRLTAAHGISLLLDHQQGRGT